MLAVRADASDFTQAERQTIKMCFSRVMLSEIMRPRLRAQVVKCASVLPTLTEVLPDFVR